MNVIISKSTSRRRARNLWENFYQEKIPKGWHIHHIDGDPFNNDITNLQVCSPKEHWKIHFTRGDQVALNGKFIQYATWHAETLGVHSRTVRLRCASSEDKWSGWYYAK